MGILLKYNQMENKGQPLGSREMPKCQVCHLQPSPESVQHLPFIFLQILVLFFSFKLAAATFLISYCFAKNGWYCPQCKREVLVDFQVEGSSENLVIRIGNCMVMLARIKFRVLAGIIVCYLLFSFITDTRSIPKYHVQKSWRSIANNCGYEAFLQNQFKANTVYEEYPKLGEWTLQGIFLRQLPNLQKKLTRIYFKMDPSQFRDPATEDIVVYQTEHTLTNYTNRTHGDVVRFVGQWEGREGEGHEFRFMATRIEGTGKKGDLSRIKLIRVAQNFIRVHQEERKESKNIEKQK